MYDQFLDWADSEGLDFPCTAEQFYARAAQFAQGNDEIIVALCEQGIGPDWADRQG